MKENFRPEVINRIDEVIVFHQLKESEITQIIDLIWTTILKVSQAFRQGCPTV